MGIISAGIVRLGAGHHPVVASHRQRDWLTLVVPAVAALLLGGYQLGKLSLWRDEAYSLEAARRSYGHIFALLHHADAVNGTYYLFLHVAIILLGTSETALRLPSLLAIAVAAATTAALGRLLARTAGLPAPWLTGLLAGLLFAVAPQATRYAQDARSYAIVTMLVTIATYLLVRAMLSGPWRWWAWYAVVIALAGFFNLFALLVVLAHGLTVLVTHRVRRRRAASAAGSGLAGSGRGSGAAPVRLRRWLVAATAAGVAVAPLAWLGFKQRGQISWLSKPGLRTVYDLFVTFAGSKALIVPIAALALCGATAGLVPWPRAPTATGLAATGPDGERGAAVRPTAAQGSHPGSPARHPGRRHAPLADCAARRPAGGVAHQAGLRRQVRVLRPARPGAALRGGPGLAGADHRAGPAERPRPPGTGLAAVRRDRGGAGRPAGLTPASGQAALLPAGQPAVHLGGRRRPRAAPRTSSSTSRGTCGHWEWATPVPSSGSEISRWRCPPWSPTPCSAPR